MELGYDFAPASGIVQATTESHEGGQTEACSDGALDDLGRFGGFVGSPVVSHGFGDAAGFDNGEFASDLRLRTSMRRRSSEKVIGVASGLSESGPVSKHGVTSFTGFQDQDWIGWDGGDFLDFPLISAHFRSFE